ncbi:MAG TPA: DUF1905 domain-containing protein [Candidatus Limnocylindrales bacterium]|nr:DUF1905 domain-containing protein [Candidatus Limnocylindrales bacterium]
MGETERVTFRGRVRYWDEAAGRGLAVVDVPADLVDRLGGRKQYRVSGTLNGAPYAGSGMLVAGGGYCVGTSAAALKSAGAKVGDEVEVAIARA